MSEAKANPPGGRYGKTVIIAAAIVVLVALLMFFRDRGQKREAQLQQMKTRMELLEHWGPPDENGQPNRPAGRGGKIL